VKPCVFIHTNHRQIVGALVARHALERNSRHPDAFDVRIIHTGDYPFLSAREDSRSAATGSSGSGGTTTCSRSRRCGSCRPN
jgi:hypothetical protein